MKNYGFAILDKIFKEFSYIVLCKTLVAHFGPALPLGVMIWRNLNLHYLSMLSLYKYEKLWLSCSLEEDFYRNISNIFLCKTLVGHFGPALPPGSRFEQTWIFTTWACFHIYMMNYGFVILEKKTFNEFCYIFLCKTLVGRFGPALPPGVMIWTNLNLHHLRMFLHKFQLSWHSGSWEEDF
jgi:hypothetical protein